MNLKICKGDKTFVATFSADATVGDLRKKAAQLTGVPTTHQKLVGIGGQPVDATLLRQCKLKEGSRVVVFRTEAARASSATSSSTSSAHSAAAAMATTTTTGDVSESDIALVSIRSAVDLLSVRVAALSTDFVEQERRSCDAELERLMLQLDAISVPSDELRAARKEEVTRIQTLLASLDQMSHQL
jgi:hypothetical protein